MLNSSRLVQPLFKEVNVPRRMVHKQVGALAGLLAAGAVSRNQQSNYNIVLLAGGLFGGRFGGTFPDVLEPACSPNHRAFFHSAIWNGGTAFFADKQIKKSFQKMIADAYALPDGNDGSINWKKTIRIFLVGATLGFAAGYASHIVLDFFSPRSLPLC
jgi:hypothetical protein